MNCVIHHWPMVITLSERDKIEKHCNSLNFKDFPSESEVVNIFYEFYSNAYQYKFSQSYFCRDNTENGLFSQIKNIVIWKSVFYFANMMLNTTFNQNCYAY